MEKLKFQKYSLRRKQRQRHTNLRNYAAFIITTIFVVVTASCVKSAHLNGNTFTTTATVTAKAATQDKPIPALSSSSSSSSSSSAAALTLPLTFNGGEHKNVQHIRREHMAVDELGEAEIGENASLYNLPVIEGDASYEEDNSYSNTNTNSNTNTLNALNTAIDKDTIIDSNMEMLKETLENSFSLQENILQQQQKHQQQQQQQKQHHTRHPQDKQINNHQHHQHHQQHHQHHQQPQNYDLGQQYQNHQQANQYNKQSFYNPEQQQQKQRHHHHNKPHHHYHNHQPEHHQQHNYEGVDQQQQQQQMTRNSPQAFTNENNAADIATAASTAPAAFIESYSRMPWHKHHSKYSIEDLLSMKFERKISNDIDMDPCKAGKLI